jgi:hypothetical protein
MRTILRELLNAAVLMLVPASMAWALTPQAVQVQGVLTDGTGNPVTDGTYSLILTGWDDSTGGTLLWTENKTIQTAGGLFQVILDGEGPAGFLAHSGQQHLQMQVAGQAPLLPRIRLASVPSALLSARMDGDVITQPGTLIIHPTGDPDFDLLRMTAVDSTASLALGGDPDFDLLRIAAGNSGASLTIKGDPDFDLLRLAGDASGGSIAIGEEGLQRIHMSGGGGTATVSLNGLPPGQPGGGLVTLYADSGQGSIAIDEEGVQVVRIQSGGGGGGGGSIAIGEEGLQVVRGIADSSSARIIAGKGNGDGDAWLKCDSSGARYNFLESWPCGAGDVEVGSDGLAFRCTPGGMTQPDTTAYLDPNGNMGLDGDLTVGGDICAVGTIGACSDARFKTDVETITGALERVSALRGVNFNWRVDEFPDKHFRAGRDFGFIAQELKEAVPQVVVLGQDGYYSVDYARLTPLLVEAVKELEAKTRRIEALEARLEALSLHVARLEGRESAAVQLSSARQ